MIKIDKKFISELLEQAGKNPRLRKNYDLRTSPDDNSQRMLNALLPGTQVPIHRHPNSTETVLVLQGKLAEIFYKEEQHIEGSKCGTGVQEVARIILDPLAGSFGCVVPAGVWHTVEVLEPSVILEVKDGKYGEDGSESLFSS